MNLIDDELNMQKEKNTKMIKIIGVSIVGLILIVVGLITYLKYIQSKQFKFILDNNTQSFSEDLFYYNEDGEMYISIKDLSDILAKNSKKSEYNKGSYKIYNEDKTECNVVFEYEVAGYQSNSNEMYKVVLDDGSYEYYSLSKPVLYVNNKLYTTTEGIEIGFNLSVSYDADSNSLKMYTLDYLVGYYSKKLNNNVIDSKDMSFVNKKVVKYDMIITQNANNEYGVQKISTGDMVLGNKYSELKFIESTRDFIVTTPEKKQGIISAKEGAKNIRPEEGYTEIKQLKNDLNLYIIKKDEKYGVYNREKQKTIIYPEYDSIGIDVEQFKNDKIENPYILYDNCIPCKKSEEGIYKWELIDINGNKIINQQYDSIGYIKGTSKNVKGNNLLLIPEVEGIIVCKDSMYGIINSIGNELIKVQLQQIYAESAEGKNTYYMVYNNQTYNVLEELKKTTNSSNTNNSNNKTTTNSNNSTKSQTNTTNANVSVQTKTSTNTQNNAGN